MIPGMYEAYFGLRETPFSITPNPRYFFLSRRHAEALAHLRYGISAGGGFIQLTGEVGTGKTMLVRCMLEELPTDVDVALILNPGLERTDFLRAICSELHIQTAADAGSHTLMQQLNRHLLDSHAAGRRTVLIVDEAQALPPATLEQIRLLTNLETESAKLLQILLVGQPELRDTLARADLRQLAQRITGRYHLGPLSRGELDRYISHRLDVAGAPGRIFTPAAVGAIHRASRGIPRLTNVLCDRALLGAYTREQRRITPRLVREADRQLAQPRRSRPPAGRLWPALVLLPAVAVAAGAAYWQFRPEPAVPAPAVTSVRSAAPTLDTLLQGGTLSDGNHAAFGALFERWGARYHPTGAPACVQAAEAGLRCLYYRGSWNTLRRLDRPAIITLDDSAGNPHQAVLTGIDRSRAALRFGNRPLEVPLAELDHYFSGNFLLLWQPPAGIAPPLTPGTAGPGVAWLRHRLGLPDGDTYDATVTAAVRDFQATHGLATDGLAGARTLVVLLNALPGQTGPRLISRPPEEH